MDINDELHILPVDGAQPLLSIVVISSGKYALAVCLDQIFEQELMRNFEVVICDDHTADGSWDVACDYMNRYPGRITASRSQYPFGPEVAADKISLLMVRGEYFVQLTDGQVFTPAYVAKVVGQLHADPLFRHSYIGRKNEYVSEAQYRRNQDRTRYDGALVSVCVYNYQYGRFLRQCLDSIAAQTYRNIEICFSDNGSSDDSWAIAVEFSKTYRGRMSLTRNRRNFGPRCNQDTTMFDARGKHMVFLCSDDAMKPAFVERCVSLLERYPDAGYAMVHRDIMDDEGRITPEPAFYDRTCLIPGRGQTAVYMMSSVNPSISQIMYNRDRFMAMDFPGTLNSRWFGARIVDFDLCCRYQMVYIDEPLLLNRVHALADGARLSDNLLQCIGEYSLVHQFADKAMALGFDETAGRLDEAVRKIGRLCLRYCARHLVAGDEVTARRYFRLSEAIFPDVVADSQYQALSGYWSNAGPEARAALLASIRDVESLIQRMVSYPPPPGSLPC